MTRATNSTQILEILGFLTIKHDARERASLGEIAPGQETRREPRLLMSPTSYFSADDTSPTAILQRYGTLPDPLESDEQAQRRAHLDLDQLEPAAMRQELVALRLWLCLQSSAHPWFRERVNRLRRKLRHGR
jgi:hypothetical protein